MEILENPFFNAMSLDEVFHNVDRIIKIVIDLFFSEADFVRVGWISILIVVSLVIKIAGEMVLVLHHNISNSLMLVKRWLRISKRF